MKDNVFWIKLWTVVATTLLLVITSAFAYNAHYNKVAAEMVKQGVNPAHVKCALDAGSIDSPVCIILATKEGSK